MTTPMMLTPKSRNSPSRDPRPRDERLAALIRLGRLSLRKTKAG
ncbi:hypothetical protein [Phenylobacterium sp.]